jgi:hypothetical protein
MKPYILLLAIVLAACVNTENRFERISESPPVTLPLKLTSVSGSRDGVIVKATIRFQESQDSAAIAIVVNVGPPPYFMTGTYQAEIAGQKSSGIVESQSLAYLGGQNALPSVGGVFILKDSENRAVYRVTMPATRIRRPIG